MAVKGNAAFTWTTASGQEAVVLLNTPIRFMVPALNRTTWAWETADKTAINVVSVGAGVYEMEGRLRFQDSPVALLQMIRDGVDQQTLRYWPDLNGSAYWDATLVPMEGPNIIEPDPDTWQWPLYDLKVLVRRSDGTPFTGWGQGSVLGQQVALRYRGGEPAGEDWTVVRDNKAGFADFFRSRDGGMGSFTAENVLRTHWVDLDGDGIFETPTTLFEGYRQNLIDESEDFTTWSTQGTPTLTGSQRSPDGGFNGYVVDDNDAGSAEGVVYSLSGGTFGSDGKKVVSVFVKPGSATDFAVSMLDQGAAQNRLVMQGQWNADGTPDITETTGVLLGIEPYKDSLGNLWFRLLMQTTSVTAANTHQLKLLGAGTAVGNTGSTRFFGAMAEDYGHPSSYVSTYGGLLGHARDDLEIPLPAALVPPGPMAVYWRWRAGYQGLGEMSAGPVWLLGSSGATTPRIDLRVTTASALGVRHHNGSVSRTASCNLGATIEVGDVVEAVVILLADGSVNVHGRLNGGTVVSGSLSSSSALPGAWTEDVVVPDISGDGSVGTQHFLACAICPGDFSGHDGDTLMRAFSNYVDRG